MSDAPTISVKRLRHVAGGLASAFFHRNNDVGGQWALGLLYRDAPADLRVQLNLLDHTTIPPTDIARLVARNYAEFLRRAALKKDIPLNELAEAKVELSFDADVQVPGKGWEFVGDPFICTVTLTLKDGRLASTQRLGLCLRYEKGRFPGRTPGDDSILESLRSGN
ncbi:hypothetical protein SAMN05428959_102625 [Duganella sp. CF517]|uniref:hypothetical protein n=1 Tax=Duganella sp. CF517 TaxID=1881038 RepID=UPI0008D74954|nr:hypothetical protein [Duganella sp. CF517]SEN61663.1 hypothetical protein SAMN05428959_102625 [Duganella sp. CF517]